MTPNEILARLLINLDKWVKHDDVHLALAESAIEALITAAREEGRKEAVRICAHIARSSSPWTGDWGETLAEEMETANIVNNIKALDKAGM